MNTTPLNEDHCWQAVLTRTDTNFFYAVCSTGIYCRPTCPARRPGRDQVCFFANADDAENAGFRACRRCRPREAAANAEAVTRVCRYIESHRDETLRLESLSALAGLSPQHFQRTFRKSVGVTPRQYADACRLGEFKAKMKNGEAVTSALIDAGYGSTSRLYERTPEQLGMTPSAYRRGGQGASVAYTTADTPLGKLLVAATAQGVCAITLGETEAELEAALRAEYPAAALTRDDAHLHTWVEALIRHLAGEQPALSLPLDVRATAFQRRVWQELQAIPYGDTRSYSQVAAAIGQPSAARAVARACATNPVALAVPCHRVVRGDGSLSGYRWGEARKKAILAQERAKRAMTHDQEARP